VEVGAVNPVALLINALDGEKRTELVLDGVSQDYSIELPVGRFELRRRYEGSVDSAQRLPFDILPADITAVTVPVEPVGGLRLRLPWPLCGTAVAIEVHRVVYGEPVDALVASRQERNCEVRVGGLRPDRYSYKTSATRGDVLAIRRTLFEAAAQQWKELAVIVPRVFVHGMVTNNGYPVAKAPIGFRRAGGVGGTTRTDEDGLYSLLLKATGDYMVTVQGYEGAMSSPEKRDLTEGDNQVDVTAAAGTVSVKLATSGARVQPGLVTVVAQGRKGSRSAQVAFSDRPVALGMLPFGKYRLWAVGNGFASDVAMIQLEHGKNEMLVPLALRPASGTVRVVGAGSEAFGPGTFHSDGRLLRTRLLGEDAYATSSMPLGAAVVIRRGKYFGCFVNRGLVGQTVTVASTVDARLEFPAGVDVGGDVSGLPNSECASVPLLPLATSVSVIGDTTVVTVKVPRGSMRLEREEGVIRIAAPGTTIVYR
jgi:hypothetical protein